MDDARRSRLAGSIFGTCTVEQAAEQITLYAAPRFREVYVERRSNAYRWSIVHGGGPYPLLRELAQLLEVSYHSIVLPFTTVDDRTIVLAPGLDGEPDAWAIIEPSADVSITAERLVDATS